VRAERPAAPAAKEPQVADVAFDAERELALLKRNWNDFVERVGNRAVSVKGALRDSRPVAVDDLHVTIGYAPEFAEEMDNFKSLRVRTVLQHVLKDILKRSVDAVFEEVEDIGECETLNAETAAEPQAVYDIPAPAKEFAADGGGGRKTRSDWQQNKDVQQVLNTFNGTIIDIR
jgi:hypothetical protein